MLFRTKLLVASALVIALLLAGASVALAQGPTPTPPKGGKSNWAQLYWDALAKRLGTTVDKLQQAMKDARKDAINEAVKKGLLTQAQADKLLQNADKRAPGALRDRLSKFNPARGFLGQDALEAAAKALNMSPADLTAALRGGKTLADLAKEKNVDPAKIQAAIADAEKAAIDRAVKNGLITKERGEELKAKIDPSKIDLSRKHFGASGFSGRGRFGFPPLPAPTPKP